MTDSQKIDLLLVKMEDLERRVGGVQGDVQSLKGDVQELKGDVHELKEKVQYLDGRMDGLEQSLKTTECNLRLEIRQSEELILSEVERVHVILENHMNDKKVHLA